MWIILYVSPYISCYTVYINSLFYTNKTLDVIHFTRTSLDIYGRTFYVDHSVNTEYVIQFTMQSQNTTETYRITCKLCCDCTASC